MPAGLALTIYLAAGLLAGTLGGTIAPRKRRHPGFWTTGAFLFPPLVIVLLFLPRGNYMPPRPQSEWDDNLDNL
jgi:hypothetical protein